ncbi:methionine aminopeptidase 1D, chloroplastic/mitochondrial-like [Mucor ambiguus]|uniref:Methionine aminopeptidase n=1 Tax=Mucor ambiguus TaxID=91626 RepID=A0A0C9MC68_9FUNG|nr:methionine aminopeptidase 1D, chloroplastic/mitochondrial-like [Mucor ambiguus]
MPLLNSFRSVFSYSSYNSYIVASNALTLAALAVPNYFAFWLKLQPFTFIFSLRLIYLSEIVLGSLCIYNIWNASGNVTHPLLSYINVPLKNVAFAPGPLLTTLKKVIVFLRTELNAPSKPAQPLGAPQPPVAPLQNLKDDVKFTSLFLKDATPQQEQQQPSNIPGVKPLSATSLDHNHSLPTVFNAPFTKSKVDEMEIARAALQHYGQADTTKPAVTLTNSGIPVTKQHTGPKLKYTPCVQPPLQPTKARERLLWFLSPTPEIVDDFRIEQMIDLQKNWNRYNDRTSRVYYDKMTSVLLKKIFIPLSQSIDFYNEMLTPRNRSVADCPAGTVMLSMVMPTAQNVTFTLPEIEDFINVNGYSHVDGRKYVLERIKDLASSSRMQTYRFLPTTAGMPTDATIIMHVFQQYLALKEPYAIPPLVPFEGDLFKFLLVYIKITPELDHWNVRNPSRKWYHLLAKAKQHCFHTAAPVNTPRGSKLMNRWGNYQRIVPASLASVDVRKMPHRDVPPHIQRPPYAIDGSSSKWGPKTPILTEQDVQGMRKAGKVAKEILTLGGSLCQPGITTNHIDKMIHEAIIANNAYPSPLNYMGFPKSVCTSINNIIAHGIPDERPLEEGDIINVDVTVYVDGYHGDTSATFLVGQVDEKGRALVACTQETLNQAMSICGPGVPYREIGQVICKIAMKNGFSVSDELSGHGIGKEFHSLPLIYHHLNDEEGVMKSGTAFTIEPILCQGSASGIMWPDEWTISTVDGGRSAQFEHTLLINDDGVEILTQ